MQVVYVLVPPSESLVRRVDALALEVRRFHAWEGTALTGTLLLTGGLLLLALACWPQQPPAIVVDATEATWVVDKKSGAQEAATTTVPRFPSDGAACV